MKVLVEMEDVIVWNWMLRRDSIEEKLDFYVSRHLVEGARHVIVSVLDTIFITLSS